MAPMTIPTRILLPAATAIVLTIAAGVALVRGAEAPGGALHIEAWARATPPGASVGAAYLIVRNEGDKDDRLVGAASPAAESVEAHETVDENGVARMRPLEGASIPAGGALVMRPGGAHLMLMGLAAPLREGSSFKLTLTFERAGKMTVEAQVGPLGADAAPGHVDSM
jgi:periplasmic copper chaperone A